MPQMETIARAMLMNAVIAAILAIVPLAIGRSGRRPSLVHGLWMLVLLKLITPPVYPLAIPWPAFPVVTAAAPEPTPFLPQAREAGRIEAVSLMEGGEDLPDEDEEPWAGSPEPIAEPEAVVVAVEASVSSVWPGAVPSWPACFLVVVAIGGLGYWSLVTTRVLRLRRLLGELRPAPDAMRDRVAAVAERIGLNRPPVTDVAPGRVPPMLWAWGGCARLIIPESLWLALDDPRRDALLAHELAHLKRKDHWVRWLDLMVAGLYWWHPVVWLARRGLRDAEEHCCDAWAVWATPRGSKTYAAALLAALEFISDAPTAGVPAASAVVGGKGPISSLKRRMTMIVHARASRSLGWTGRFGLLGLATLVLPLAPSWAQTPEASRDDAAQDRSSRAVAIAYRDDDDDDKDKDKVEDKALREGSEAVDRLQKLLGELGGRISKEVGPVGEEVSRAIDRAAKEISEALGKEGVNSAELRQAIDKAQAELRESFRRGGPIETRAREAFENARAEMNDAAEKSREELRESVRERAEAARRSARQRFLPESAEEGEKAEADEAAEDEKTAEGSADQAPGSGGEVENARREVRRMEQQLRQAVRELENLEREANRNRGRRFAPRREFQAREPLSRRGPRRPFVPVPPQAPGSEAPVSPDARPAPPAPPEAPAPPDAPASPDARPAPPAPPEAPAPPEGPRAMRRGRPDGSFNTAPNPRLERRLNDLEGKMDRLLKELENFKNEKKESDKAKERKDDDSKEREEI